MMIMMMGTYLAIKSAMALEWGWVVREARRNRSRAVVAAALEDADGLVVLAEGLYICAVYGYALQ